MENRMSGPSAYIGFGPVSLPSCLRTSSILPSPSIWHRLHFLPPILIQSFSYKVDSMMCWVFNLKPGRLPKDMIRNGSQSPLEEKRTHSRSFHQHATFRSFFSFLFLFLFLVVHGLGGGSFGMMSGKDGSAQENRSSSRCAIIPITLLSSSDDSSYGYHCHVWYYLFWLRFLLLSLSNP